MKSLLESWVAAFVHDWQSPLNLCSIYIKITWVLAFLPEHMDKKFEVNWTKINGGCQSCRKVAAHDSKSNLPLLVFVSMYLSATDVLLKWHTYIFEIESIQRCHISVARMTKHADVSYVTYDPLFCILACIPRDKTHSRAGQY